VWALSALVWFSTGVIAQAYRYRQVSNRTQRQQTKWVVFGLTIAFVGFFTSTLLDAVLSLRDQPGSAGVFFSMVWTALFLSSIMLVPLSIGVSILRYRLWDIDLIINRTLVYVPLTAILAGLYSASMTVLQEFFVALTGNRSEAAIVLTTLFLVSVTTPIKSAIQEAVDRHFKEVPDPTKRLKAFAEQVQSRLFLLDVERVMRRLLEEAVAAFNAMGGAVYLKEHGQWQLLYKAGEWTGDAQLSLPLESDGAWFGLLSLAERRDGNEYAARDRETLRRVMDLIAQTIKHQQDVHLDTQ
jgi:hypothetical protein